MSSDDKNIAIRVKDLHKTFRIPLEGGNNLKQRIVNFTRHKKGYREFSPLNGVSFEIQKGEFFGIVGRNGSGKSTLLKTIAGIYEADRGHVKVNGKLVPFIELGVGFNPELTGRENVYLNGALLGFSREEMTAMYDDIVEFAELEDFMDERLKNYSSGMQVRLAFSIAIRAEGDVLLLDEVLAVGDQAFQQKCYDYFGQLKNTGKTVILVTHSMNAVEQFCSRALLLEGGRVKAIGTNMEISEEYKKLFMSKNEANLKKQNKKNNEKKIESDFIRIDKVSVIQSEKKVNSVEAFKPFAVEIIYEALKDLGPAACGLNVVNSKNIIVLATGIGGPRDDDLRVEKGMNKITFYVDQNIFTEDRYYLNLAFTRGSKDSYQELIYQQNKVLSFSVDGILNRPHSLIHPKVRIITTEVYEEE